MPQEFPAIRLVALDLDGTLLNREGHVTPRTRAALQAAVDKGVYIVPATGRPLASLPPEVAQLPGIRYVITCNGAAVWDLGSDPVGAVYSRYSNAKEHRTSTPVCLLHSLMPVETAREAFAVCESCHADLRIFSDGYVYVAIYQSLTISVGVTSRISSTSWFRRSSRSLVEVTTRRWYSRRPVPAGIRWPQMTFSFMPSSESDLPLMAASLSTLVVSWKEAADMKLEVCRAARVIP